MKEIKMKKYVIFAIPNFRRLKMLTGAMLLGLACLPLAAKDHDRAAHYEQINLVADVPGVALVTDTNLVNAWGIAASATSPFWISDNGTGKSTLYAVTNDSTGLPHVHTQGLVVTIPGAGTPTGQVFDGTGSFRGDVFLFVSEDGTISGWRGALGTTAETFLTRSNAVYKGVALATTTNGPLLLAANFAEGTVDAYSTNGTNLILLSQFMDPHAPVGYAPFNVQVIGEHVFVTFARQDAAKHDDVPGEGHGLIDILNPNNGKFFRFATGKDAGGKLKEINSPWGLVVSPRGFGLHEDHLLVGNFGSGTIMSFEANGEFGGLLKSTNHAPVVIDGLWALRFGNGGNGGDTNTLYFTAGPGGESHGLFGSLTPAPKREHGHDHDDEDDD